MHKFKLDNRKMQEATGNAEPGGGQPAQQAQPTTQGGAFANLMARLGFGSNQQTTMPATNNQQQQPTAQPATDPQQQAPQQAAPLPSEFFGKLFTKQEPAQPNTKDPKEPPFFRIKYSFKTHPFLSYLS